MTENKEIDALVETIKQKQRRIDELVHQADVYAADIEKLNDRFNRVAGSNTEALRYEIGKLETQAEEDATQIKWQSASIDRLDRKIDDMSGVLSGDDWRSSYLLLDRRLRNLEAKEES